MRIKQNAIKVTVYSHISRTAHKRGRYIKEQNKYNNNTNITYTKYNKTRIAPPSARRRVSDVSTAACQNLYKTQH